MITLLTMFTLPLRIYRYFITDIEHTYNIKVTKYIIYYEYVCVFVCVRECRCVYIYGHASVCEIETNFLCVCVYVCVPALTYGCIYVFMPVYLFVGLFKGYTWHVAPSHPHDDDIMSVPWESFLIKTYSNAPGKFVTSNVDFESDGDVDESPRMLPKIPLSQLNIFAYSLHWTHSFIVIAIRAFRNASMAS